MYTARERIYQSPDGVPSYERTEGSTLLMEVGTSISDAEAERLGLTALGKPTQTVSRAGAVAKTVTDSSAPTAPSNPEFRAGAWPSAKRPKWVKPQAATEATASTESSASVSPATSAPGSSRPKVPGKTKGE